MQGQMMDRPLLTTEILKHATRTYRDTEVVTRTVEGPIHRYTVGDCAKRVAQFANALIAMGVKKGDRIGVIGWNSYRQLEMYYAVGGIGAILHTINPRLGPENAAFVINHAEDDYLFYDTTFAPLIAAIRPALKSVKSYFILSDADHARDADKQAGSYEDLVRGESENIDWPDFDENTAVAMCYTSGTTGDPKGVIYSHRALVIQTFASICQVPLG